MITFLTGLLIVVSLSLVVAVPVALATPGEWQSTRSTYSFGFQVWVILVLLVALADGIQTTYL